MRRIIAHLVIVGSLGGSRALAQQAPGIAARTPPTAPKAEPASSAKGTDKPASRVGDRIPTPMIGEVTREVKVDTYEHTDGRSSTTVRGTGQTSISFTAVTEPKSKEVPSGATAGVVGITREIGKAAPAPATPSVLAVTPAPSSAPTPTRERAGRIEPGGRSDHSSGSSSPSGRGDFSGGGYAGPDHASDRASHTS
jgi:hypothetical protein